MTDIGYLQDILHHVIGILPYGARFNIYTDDGDFVGTYTSNCDFQIRQDGDENRIVMVTTSMFETKWSSCVTIWKNDKFNKGIIDIINNQK